MITTITLNASVDKLYLVEQVEMGTVMRVKTVSNSAGGKGLNVSKIAALAGEKVNALGFLGGFNGQYVRSLLKDYGIESNFIETAGETRSCINIRNLATNEHTEFLEPGLPVTAHEISEFINSFEQAMKTTDVITISGSVPAGVPAAFYSDLILRARAAGKPIILDTSGELLIEGVKAKPNMIKPNVDEIAQITGKTVDSLGDLIAAATKLHNDGIPYVVISLGKEGSLLVCDEGIFRGITPDIPIVNTVGCGDSMVAGFAVGITRGYNAAEMLRYATAISTANALAIPTGYFEQEDLKKLLAMVEVKKLEI